jgi:hypothetical protein
MNTSFKPHNPGSATSKLSQPTDTITDTALGAVDSVKNTVPNQVRPRARMPISTPAITAPARVPSGLRLVIEVAASLLAAGSLIGHAPSLGRNVREM